jgi:hypothetical protein
MSDWRKSTRSHANGHCVEAASWRKSTRSEAGNCVAAAHGTGVIGIRDTQDPHLTLEISPAAWRGLLAVIKSGS